MFALKAIGALMALAAPVVCVVETQIPRHDVSPAGAVLVLVGLLLFGLGRLAEPEDRPAHPDSPAVLTIHGGAADPYQALVDGAIDYAAQAPALGVVCDHGGGHSTGLGSDGAAFLAAADVGAPHPWSSGLPTWTAQHYCVVTP